MAGRSVNRPSGSERPVMMVSPWPEIFERAWQSDVLRGDMWNPGQATKTGMANWFAIVLS